MLCYLCNTGLRKDTERALICPSCRDGFVPVSFNRCVAVDKEHLLNYTTLFLYDFSLKQALRRFKFGREIRLTKLFINLFLEHISFLDPPDIIVPVPSHPLSNIRRGYIPMFLIAKKISSVCGIHAPYFIRKSFFKISNLSQRFQNREQRLTRKADRFYIKKRDTEGIKGKKILLIDDVITTGATITECAGLLYRHGAKEVEALALAATPI